MATPRKAAGSSSVGATAMSEAFNAATATPQQPQQPYNTPVPPINHGGLRDLLTARRSSRLSSLGEAYIQHIKDKLGNIYEIEAKTSINSESLIVYKQSKKTRDAVLIIFADSSDIDVVNHQTVSHNIVGSITNQLRKEFANWNLVQIVTIKEIDYPRVDRMCTLIINSLEPTKLELSIAALKTNDSLIFKADKIKAAKAIDVESPHSVPARADLGFTIEIANKGYDVNGQPIIEPILVAAATGYVEFRRMDLSDSMNYAGLAMALPYQYQPVIVISDMISMISDINILPYMLAGIYDAWITAREWATPFKRLSNQDRNLGNLIVEKNKMKECKRPEAFFEVINNHIKPPVLMIDCTEGRAKMKNLNAVLTQPGLLEKITGQFLGVSHILPAFYAGAEDRVIGFYKQGNELHDSREIDALQLAVNIKNPNVLEMTKPANSPISRIVMQNDLASHVEAVYYNTRREFSNDYLSIVHNAIIGTDVLNKATADYGMGQMYQEQAYLNMVKPMIGQTMQQRNPVNYYQGLI